ncbi:MAG: NUDIX hydrolase [Thermoanaerobacteraceae bacterium]|nr:NUDIX hydrolase [Thermoanaerobacteraceae bacterium]
MLRTYPLTPLVGVGAIVVHGEALLLVKRGRPPAKGAWSIPGGKVETGETLTQALRREVEEECGLTIRIGPPVAVLDSIYTDDQGRVKYHYVLVDFWAEYVSGALSPASDVMEARWVPLREVGNHELTAGTLELLRELGLFADPPHLRPSGLLYRTLRGRTP